MIHYNFSFAYCYRLIRGRAPNGQNLTMTLELEAVSERNKGILCYIHGDIIFQRLEDKMLTEFLFSSSKIRSSDLDFILS
jgi:hypothetical protein